MTPDTSNYFGQQEVFESTNVRSFYAVWSDARIPTTLAGYLSYEVCKYSADCTHLPF